MDNDLIFSEVASNDIIFGLLLEFKDQRDSLKKMVEDLEKVKKTIDKLFPEKLDARNMRFIEEKIKSATALFSSILDVRKEITKTVKEEIELRRKIDQSLKGEDSDLEKLLDIRSIAKSIKKLNNENGEIKNG